LTLCDTSAFMPPREIWDERIETVRKNGMDAVADATIDRWFTKAGQERLHAEVEKIRQVILNPDFAVKYSFPLFPCISRGIGHCLYSQLAMM